MADLKISQLPAAVVVNDTDELVLARGGSTLKTPASLIRKTAIDSLQASLTSALAAITQLQTDLDALELEIGANPSGAFADLVARLNAFQGMSGAIDTGWSVANYTSDKGLDQDSYSMNELADILCTLTAALIARGVISA
jgi:hypothetical protein